MKRIGLTGNIGTGKSTVARVFEILGVPVYHADIQARHLLNQETVKVRITELFGESILTHEKQVDRKALAAIVFDDKEKLDMLNSLIHPLVEADFLKWCNSLPDTYYIIHEAAILFESGFNRLFDATILVTAPEELCIARVMKRDGVTPEMITQRILNQWPQERKIKLADFLVQNDEASMIIPQVLEIHRKILAG